MPEKSLQRFMYLRKYFLTTRYIRTLEQLRINQSEVCKLYIEIIELQEKDLQYKKRRISLLERLYAMATEQNIITISSDTLSKAEGK